MDKEVVFKVNRVKDDHWGEHYLANPSHENLGGATEARSYDELKEKIREFLRVSLKNGYHKEIGLQQNPQIRLIYSELLFENPGAERIVIAGARENGGYKVSGSCKGSFIEGLNLYHDNLETLRKMVLEEVRKKGDHTKNVEFRLEEVL